MTLGSLKGVYTILLCSGIMRINFPDFTAKICHGVTIFLLSVPTQHNQSLRTNPLLYMQDWDIASTNYEFTIQFGSPYITY